MRRSELSRRLGLALAGARVVLGASALLGPELSARPWVGAAPAGQAPVRVFARAMGGRDVALGAGTALALRAGSPARPAAVWLAASAVADAVDVLATAAAWRWLPARGRVLVTLAASGAAISGALVAANV